MPRNKTTSKGSIRTAPNDDVRDFTAAERGTHQLNDDRRADGSSSEVPRSDAGFGREPSAAKSVAPDTIMIVDLAVDDQEKVEGWIDYLDEGSCCGWFTGVEEPSLYSVVARVGAWQIGSAKINIYRDDIRRAGHGSGEAGFRLKFQFPIDPSLISLLTIEVIEEALQKVVKILRSPDDSIDMSSELIADFDLFDSDYYISTYDEVGIFDPVAHYYLNGRFRGLKPNFIFDPEFYVEYSKVYFDRDVSLSGALSDFSSIGQAIGARPHPIFDPFLVSANSYIRKDQALQFYLKCVVKDSIQTSLLFWNDWYKKKYNVNFDILRHYLDEGIRLLYNPNPLFDSEGVRNRLSCASEVVLQAYLIREATLKVKTHDLINPDYIMEQIEQGEFVRPGLSSLEIYVQSHLEINPHPLFDNQFYQQGRPFDGSEVTLLSDYLNQPTSDLKPHPLFWDAAYMAARPDVAMAGCPPLEHYVRSGFREQVETHPLLEHGIIAHDTSSSGQETVLEHYIKDFLRQRIRPFGDKAVETTITKMANTPVLKIPNRASTNNMNGAVGLFAHVYYTDLLHEVAAVAKNLPSNAKIYISTDTRFKAEEIKIVLPTLCDLEVEVRVLPNRGRDIAPFLIGFSDRIQEVTYGLHIHTKKSPHYSSAFEKWRKYLYSELAGTTEIVATHLSALQDPKVGMSAPIDFAPLGPLLNWGGNRTRAQRLVNAMGGSLPSGTSPELPSGSMFWFKSAALKPFFDLGLTLAHFDPEAGQVDGTLAHAIERCFFHICELSGHQFIRTTTQGYVEGLDLTHSVATAMARRLPSAWSREGILEQYHPETKKFVAACSHGGPRLNLLIPTADMSVGYAGVSEAIRLFMGALDRLGNGWSGRIVMTDVPPSNMFTPPAGYRLVDNFAESETANFSVVNGCDKSREFFTLREQDVFVASAWWNAAQSYDLIDQADALFEKTIHKRKVLYLVQDDERGFNAWSTKYKLCDDTYNHTDRTFAVFNTPLLADHFKTHSLSSHSTVYKPPINSALRPELVTPYRDRENIVLLYSRPHALRNSLDFIDALVGECLKGDRKFWRSWRWIAIGEEFSGRSLKSSDHIEVKGRLSLDDYRSLLARAKLGVSLMISPHPSYPPLEMAAHGLRVVANRFEGRDPSALHSGIYSFTAFDPTAVSLLLKAAATADTDLIQEPRVDWFFNDKTNANEVFDDMAAAAQNQFMIEIDR